MQKEDSASASGLGPAADRCAIQCMQLQTVLCTFVTLITVILSFFLVRRCTSEDVLWAISRSLLRPLCQSIIHSPLLIVTVSTVFLPLTLAYFEANAQNTWCNRTIKNCSIHVTYSSIYIGFNCRKLFMKFWLAIDLCVVAIYSCCVNLTVHNLD